MNNPRHVEALKLFSTLPDKSRSEYVVNCILKCQQEDRMAEMVRQTVREALTVITFSSPAGTDIPVTLQTTENLSDLPQALVCAMDEM
jgi:hypothetical protein